MQINGERIHRNDFAFVRTREIRKALFCVAMIGNPRPSRVKMALDTDSPPVFEFLLYAVKSPFRLQS